MAMKMLGDEAVMERITDEQPRITHRAVALFKAWQAGHFSSDDYDDLAKELRIEPWETDPRDTRPEPPSWMRNEQQLEAWKTARDLYESLCEAAGIEGGGSCT